MHMLLEIYPCFHVHRSSQLPFVEVSLPPQMLVKFGEAFSWQRMIKGQCPIEGRPPIINLRFLKSYHHRQVSASKPSNDSKL